MEIVKQGKNSLSHKPRLLYFVKGALYLKRLAVKLTPIPLQRNRVFHCQRLAPERGSAHEVVFSVEGGAGLFQSQPKAFYRRGPDFNLTLFSSYQVVTLAACEQRVRTLSVNVGSESHGPIISRPPPAHAC